MKRVIAWLGLLGGALSMGAGAAWAQSSGDLLAQGLRAYRNLEFALAAGLLRRHVAQLGASGAPVPDRAQALVYLGAADLFRGRRDSAAAVFRRLIVLDPRYRPDRLIFPPEVTAVFDSARQATKTVLIVVPGDTEIVPGAQALSVWLVVSSSHTVEVTLRYEDGGPFRSLYYGVIDDSLKVRWDGLDAAGQAPVVGRVLLRVASRAASGQLMGTLQRPLELRVIRPDTLPWPPEPAESLFLPERAAAGPAKRALMGGALLSAAVVSLPAVVGGHETSGGPRVVVAGTVALAGVFGYILHRPGRPLEANIRANQAARGAWEQRLADVKAENARRGGDIRLRIRPGEPTAIQPRGP